MVKLQGSGHQHHARRSVETGRRSMKVMEISFIFIDFSSIFGRADRLKLSLKGPWRLAEA